MKNYIFLALSLVFSAPAWAAKVEISGLTPVSLNLAQQRAIPLRVKADEAVELDLQVDFGELGAEARAGTLAIEVMPHLISLKAGEETGFELRVLTKSNSPSFEGKHISLNALQRGSRLARAEMELSVKPVYVVKVIDGAPFDFDSPAELLKFSPHQEGLQIVFENYSSRECVIHGDGAIEHEDTDFPMRPAQRGPDGVLRLDPKGTYAPPPILPYAGRDFSGTYTIHGVYHPVRNVVVNSTE